MSTAAVPLLVAIPRFTVLDGKKQICLCRMTEECFKKCMDKKFREGELNLGETSCVDRCCHKYWQATAIVGQLLGVHVQKNAGQ